MKQKYSVWISFDLGVKGDYDGIYSFLDKVKAAECGDFTAFIKVNTQHEIVGLLKNQINEFVKLNERDRIYVIICRSNGHVFKSGFLFGKRKAAPWSGFFSSNNNGSLNEILR